LSSPHGVERKRFMAKQRIFPNYTPYELQIYFAFQKEDNLKKVTKLLAKEKKAEKLRQYKKFYNKD
jgi:hypothetical protein